MSKQQRSRQLSIKQKLYLAFASIVAIILALLALAYNNFANMAEANRLDKHSMQVLRTIAQLNAELLQVQVEARNYYLTGAPDAMAATRRELGDLPASIARARALVADNPDQSARLRRIAEQVPAWIAEVVEPQMAQRQAAGTRGGAADAIGQAPQMKLGNPLVRAIYQTLEQTTTEENRLLGMRSLAARALQHDMLLVLSAGGAVCVTLALLVAWLLTRSLTLPLGRLTEAVGQIAAGRRGARAEVLADDELGLVARELNRMAQAIEDNLAREQTATELLRGQVDRLLAVVSRAAAGDLGGRVDVAGGDAIGRLGDGIAGMLDKLRGLIDNVQKAGIQVTTSATEIAASARQQEATGIEQAQTSVEILSTSKEIAANTGALLKTMQEATAVADYTTSATAGAQDNLRRMDATMQHMVAATDSINAKLAALSDKASNINGVLTTITKVADQTNILSLNAAIEAEKAGEAGRGFSVVATEIRRLADQTSVSTWDIEQMLKEMQSAVSASVMGMDKFSEEIRRSVGEVRQVTEQLSGVMQQVQKLAPQFDAVLQGMQSQAVGAAQISSTMAQLNDATQQSVESLKATSEAVHQLQYAAGDLQASVASFALAA
ncbi:methyl-accepting chemotaxis protein [Rugamonas sp. CCM 8940]|uniref:methyl-accepting chemotaxis protein n=1 Tax=Rugamonas sp. CCM 8940 TaxID=2765359 RepID=UPI0018F3EB1C|nr:methyl-accepting chemotaxis protein [Rugamonas sp. CCM 8940]MBJ7308844.1 CHASE3 domain-containing protein [Rugamonas sp. CCM 8940]